MQRRGVERAQAILDAAEALLGEQGYEAATLKAISDRARIPLASVYHYFADRNQVDTELALRHTHELDERLDAALNRAEPGTLRAVCDTVIDELLAYFRAYPSFVELWYAGRSAPLRELAQAFDMAQAKRLRRFLVERDLIRADVSELVVQLALEAGDRLFDVAFRDSSTGDRATIDEARRLVTAYLETYAPQA
ncbi:TetR/AcrR family transcriptional regulator [Nocardia xishanensis]